MLVALTVGVLVGSVAGMSSGWVDAALMWLTDLFLALPTLPLLLLVMYLFRDSMKKVLGVEGGAFVLIVVVIGGLRWMPVARLVRAQFLSLREKEFVEAARALGASKVRQVVQHILPNALGPVIVVGTIDVAAAIIVRIDPVVPGPGLPVRRPDLGLACCATPRTISTSPRTGRCSRARAIFLTVLAINFIGDGLRDALDPRRVL